MFEQNEVRRRKLQRLLAAFLILLMVSDLGFHLVDPFFHSSADPGGIVILAAGQLLDPVRDCGIPGHDGTPFHHHHFPTLVSQTASPAPLMALAWLAGLPPIDFVQSALVAPIGRSPPIRF